jgi:hypothetical protein
LKCKVAGKLLKIGFGISWLAPVLEVGLFDYSGDDMAAPL